MQIASLKVMSIFKNIIVQFECFYCHSLFVYRLGLCEICHNKLIDEYWQPQELLVSEETMQYTLFQWPGQKSRILNAMVVRLKSPLYEPVWSEIARLFLASFNFLKDDKSKTVFVCIPSTDKFRTHSEYFATCLSTQTGVPVYDCLRWAEKFTPQKNLNKYDRKKIALYFDEEFTSYLNGVEKIILVDDVVTTGSTLGAAKQALLKVTHARIEYCACFRRLELTEFS